MSDIFYDTPLKLYQCSQIPSLDPSIFLERQNQELRTMFAHLVLDTFQYKSNSLLIKTEPPTLRYLKEKTKISFKQETIAKDKEYLISYMMIKFPKELKLKRQIFVFIQNDEKTFSTLLLHRTSIPKISLLFVKWCEHNLGSCVLIKSLKFSTNFVKETINMVFNNYYLDDDLHSFGDLILEFKVKTKSNALNIIKIEISNDDLLQYVQGFPKKSLDIVTVLFDHFENSTQISFNQLKIVKLEMSNTLLINSSEETINKLQFFNEGLDITRTDEDEDWKITVYDYILKVFDSLLK